MLLPLTPINTNLQGITETNDVSSRSNGISEGKHKSNGASKLRAKWTGDHVVHTTWKWGEHVMHPNRGGYMVYISSGYHIGTYFVELDRYLPYKSTISFSSRVRYETDSNSTYTSFFIV